MALMDRNIAILQVHSFKFFLYSSNNTGVILKNRRVPMVSQLIERMDHWQLSYLNHFVTAVFWLFCKPLQELILPKGNDVICDIKIADCI